MVSTLATLPVLTTLPDPLIFAALVCFKGPPTINLATMSQNSTICDLPAEILLMIVNHLDAFSTIWLQRSCRLFHGTIPSPTHLELIKAETTYFGTQNDLYACRDCLRLRPRAKFADNMVKRKKSKWGEKVTERWCVDCGIKPRPGTNRYTAGNIITILGVPFVICSKCRKFREGASENGKLLFVCQVCRGFTRAIEERAELDKSRHERARLRAEQAARRARRRETWGSASDSDDLPPSITSSEEYMEMIQAEADTYMNSPGPGSD
ncbi:hypothetical protein N7495_006312 [Penicillium taxi]|uniref:uncharacterized protein n=1 Tax=Penicillium taxi TaxID=168475 RepID=UPI002544FA31|nr:uncharacterized protein N7495_006312 [Penicillium taxi]KAJ5894621.1 hypothetical protein N7495_006312 [Penicillium taxi]